MKKLEEEEKKESAMNGKMDWREHGGQEMERARETGNGRWLVGGGMSWGVGGWGCRTRKRKRKGENLTIL